MGSKPKDDHYAILFPRQERLELDTLAEHDAPPVNLWPKVEIGGVIVDFAGPLEIIRAARAICALADREARRKALAQVPAHFRNSVRILVEREFYHRSRDTALALAARGEEEKR